MREFFAILLVFVPLFLFAEEKNSNLIYKEEIKEFDIAIDRINNELKKESKDIAYLKNSLINNEISTSRLFVKLINKDKGFFNITDIKIKMNNKVILDKKNLDKDSLIIFNDRAEPGIYKFDFDLTVQGAGYGIFTYMKSYKYRITQTLKVEVHDIRKTKLKLIIYKKDVSGKDPKNMLGIKIEK